MAENCRSACRCRCTAQLGKQKPSQTNRRKQIHEIVLFGALSPLKREGQIFFKRISETEIMKPIFEAQGSVT